jgi:hypothetical protein
MTLTEWEDMWIDLSRAQREVIHVDWDAVIEEWEQSTQNKVVYLHLTAGGYDGQRTQA